MPDTSDSDRRDADDFERAAAAFFDDLPPLEDVVPKPAATPPVEEPAEPAAPVDEPAPPVDEAPPAEEPAPPVDEPALPADLPVAKKTPAPASNQPASSALGPRPVDERLPGDPPPFDEPLPQVDPPPRPRRKVKTPSIHDLPILDYTPPAFSSSIAIEEAEIKRHRIRRGILVGLALWVFVAFAMMAMAFISIRNARAQLSGTKAELSLSNLQEGSAPGAESTAASMGRAHSLLGSPIVAPFKLIPIIGRQIRAVDGLAASSERTIRIGLDARRRALPVANDTPSTGAERLEALETAHDIAKDANAELAKLDLGPGNNLIGPLASTRAEFANELNRIGDVLQRTEIGAGGMAAFLKGPSRYALFAANNAEMRAGSGMYLSAGTLEVNNGELKLGPMQSIYDLPPAPDNVALEYDYLRLWGLQAPGSDYRFVNMTPRFPTSAALLQRMWAASGAPEVDGIIVLDPVAISELIKLVGTVRVGNQTINPNNAIPLFLHDQYLQYETGKTVERRDFLADVVQEVFRKLNAGSFDPRKLGDTLGNAAAGRHLLAWTPEKSVQRAWSAMGMDGVLPDQSLMFALQNRGGNKLDYFQRVSATARTTISRAGSDVEVDFLITNATPAGEPKYIAGPVPGSVFNKPGIYVGIASINLPANATKVKLTGGDYDLVEGPDGNTQVKSTFLQIDPGETVKLKLSFRLPPGYRALAIMPSARVPSVLWHTGKLSWSDTKTQIIAW